MQLDRKVAGEQDVDNKDLPQIQDLLAFDPINGAVTDFPTGAEFLSFNQQRRLRNEPALIRVLRYARVKCSSCLGRGSFRVSGSELFTPCGCLRPYVRR